MIKTYLISNFRALWKNRSHAIINMFGLALGITCSILIFLILRLELSFDNYHPDKERVYRVVTEFYGEETGHSAGVTYPLVPAMRQDFSDPEYVTIVDSNLGDVVISLIKEDGKTEKFKEEEITFADPEYFKIFQYEWIAGNTNALEREKTVVVTESIAKKYFGNAPALNKVIRFNDKFDATVSGVVKDPPLNTDLPFQLIFSFRLGADKRGWDHWGGMSSSVNCYIKLNPQVSEEQFESKLKGWHYKYFTGENEEDGKNRTYLLQPLEEIHFDTNYGNFGSRTTSKLTLLTLFFIGTVMLLTACINFVNLNTVLIISRSKEAGIRKVMGSTRLQLVMQFLGETFVITLLAMLISIGLVELAVIYLTPVLGYRLEFYPLTDLTTSIFLIALPIVVTLLSGLYPGISLSSFQPIQALRNKFSGNPGEGLTLRRTLITFQLVISQVLIVCTIIVIQQLNHFMRLPLGINSDAIVEFRVPDNRRKLVHSLVERLQNIPGVQHVALSNTGATANNTWAGEAKATVNGKLVKTEAQVKFATEDYVKTYQLTLLHGEDLIKSDTATRFLVNESFTKKLGFENSRDAIGIPVELWDNKAVISGVVKDFHSNSLHRKIEPVVIMCKTDSYYRGALKLATSNTKETLAVVQKTWEDIYPQYVFEYRFLDETIAKFYDSERRNSYLIGIFAGVAILISCIGLFGLVSFMAKSKTKEVGIRKTLGASVAQVVSLFSKEFILLILVSFVLSIPLTYYFMEQWLENFAYRIHPGVFNFLLGVTLTFIVVLGTVGIKSYKAATANPVDALRDE